MIQPDLSTSTSVAHAIISVNRKMHESARLRLMFLCALRTLYDVKHINALVLLVVLAYSVRHISALPQIRMLSE